MLSNQLSALLAPYKKLVNKNALSPTYRCLEMSPGKVIGCSAAVILETKCDHGLTDTTYVEAHTFLAVMNSLADGQEVHLSVDDGVMAWKCGNAHGKIATMTITGAMPAIRRRAKVDDWTGTASFQTALQLGSLSCGSAGIDSVNMYGVVLDRRYERMIVCSSDNTTVAACYADGDKYEGPDTITITPEAAALLADLMIPDQGAMQFDETTVFYADKHCKCLIKGIPALKHDPMVMVRQFDTHENAVELPTDAIASFIKRASALAQSARSTFVNFHATDGQMALSFDEGLASTDEYYLVKDMEVGDLSPILLDATRLARAMTHVSELNLDHLDRDIVMLRGEEPSFRYLIAGKGAN